MQVRGILFDLDDALYAYSPCNERGLHATHDMFNRRVAVSYERFRALHNDVRDQLAKDLANQAASHNRALFFKRMGELLTGRCEPDLVSNLYDCYWQTFYQHMQPGPDANLVLSKLSRSYRLALVSNHTTLAQLGKVHQLDFARYFPIIVTSEEAGVEKPDAGIFDFALKQLGLKADEVVMVGDSLQADIGGARRAGIQTIHTMEYVKQESEDIAADYTIHRLREMLDIL